MYYTMIIRRKQKEYSLRMTRGLVGINRVLGKSPMQANRAAIRQQDKILTPVAKGAAKVQKVNNAIKSAAMNPGGAVSRGTEELLRHPISVTSQVAGKATMAVDPTGIGLVPIGAIGTGGEMALRKYVPKYARATDNLGNKYHNSRAPRIIESGTNAVIGSLKNMLS